MESTFIISVVKQYQKSKKDGSDKQFVTYAGDIAVPPNNYIIDGYIYYSYVNMDSPLCVIKNYNTAGKPTLEVKDGTGLDWQTLFTKQHNVYKVEGYEEGYNYFHITYAKIFVGKYYPSGNDAPFKISKIVHRKGEIENVPSIAFIKLMDSGKYEIPYMLMK